MQLSEDQLLSIVERLSKRYGPDIAHDVTVVLLEYYDPLIELEHWVMKTAYGLRHKEWTRRRKLRLFVDSPGAERLLMNLSNGRWIT